MSKKLLRPDGSQIAYSQITGKTPGVIYLGGFKADMSGDKATFLEKVCREQGRAYIRFDYFGHGASSGDFKEGLLGRWKNDALAVLDELSSGPQILVGSSMGGWLMLLLALERPERIAGLLGIAPAPDFTQDLLDKLKKNFRDELISNGICYVPSSYANEPPFPITLKLIEEGANHCVLNRPIPIHCPVRLIHGTNDQDVPWKQSIKLIDALESNDVRLMLIKNANHRLSSVDNLKELAKLLDSLL